MEGGIGGVVGIGLTRRARRRDGAKRMCCRALGGVGGRTQTGRRRTSEPLAASEWYRYGEMYFSEGRAFRSRCLPSSVTWLPMLRSSDSRLVSDSRCRKPESLNCEFGNEEILNSRRCCRFLRWDNPSFVKTCPWILMTSNRLIVPNARRDSSVSLESNPPGNRNSRSW